MLDEKHHEQNENTARDAPASEREQWRVASERRHADGQDAPAENEQKDGHDGAGDVTSETFAMNTDGNFSYPRKVADLIANNPYRLGRGTNSLYSLFPQRSFGVDNPPYRNVTEMVLGTEWENQQVQQERAGRAALAKTLAGLASPSTTTTTGGLIGQQGGLDFLSQSKSPALAQAEESTGTTLNRSLAQTQADLENYTNIIRGLQTQNNQDVGPQRNFIANVYGGDLGRRLATASADYSGGLDRAIANLGAAQGDWRNQFRAALQPLQQTYTSGLARNLSGYLTGAEGNINQQFGDMSGLAKKMWLEEATRGRLAANEAQSQWRRAGGMAGPINYMTNGLTAATAPLLAQAGANYYGRLGDITSTRYGQLLKLLADRKAGEDFNAQVGYQLPATLETTLANNLAQQIATQQGLSAEQVRTLADMARQNIQLETGAQERLLGRTQDLQRWPLQLAGAGPQFRQGLIGGDLANALAATQMTNNANWLYVRGQPVQPPPAEGVPPELMRLALALAGRRQTEFNNQDPSGMTEAGTHSGAAGARGIDPALANLLAGFGEPRRVGAAQPPWQPYGYTNSRPGQRYDNWTGQWEYADQSLPAVSAGGGGWPVEEVLPPWE